MQSATAEDLTILNFGMGSAMAATVMDLLAGRRAQGGAVPGQVRRAEEDEGRRLHPADRRHPRRGDEQRLHAAGDPGPAVVPPPEGGLGDDRQARAATTGPGTVYTTNRRVWEHDEKFKEYLQARSGPSGIDMETATIFIVGFVNHIPKGALLLVSDSPMTPEGVKTSPERQGGDREVRAARTWRSGSTR